MTTPTPVPPALNGQIIGQTERATRAVLDELLADHDTSFHRWVTLRLIATSDPAPTRDQLHAQLTTGLRIGAAVADAEIDDSIAASLLTAVNTADDTADDTAVNTADGSEAGATISLSALGRDRYDAINTRLAEITDRFYGDIDPDDLATARRVLLTVTARANEELAAAG